MLIISDYKDYYDSVAYSKGVDKTIVYRRTELGVQAKELYHAGRDKSYRFPSYKINVAKRGEVKEFKTYIIGFCGKLYPMMILETSTGSYVSDPAKTSYIYDIDVIEELCKKYDNFSYYPFYIYKNMLTDGKVLDLFYKHKTPIFMLRQVELSFWGKVSGSGCNVQINTELKRFEFYKVVDSYTAFQEIEMYISGVLGVDSQKPIEVSDRSKIEGHGFDYRWSFRKHKDDPK